MISSIMHTQCFSGVLLVLEDLGRIEALSFSSDRRKIVSLDFGFDLFYGLGATPKAHQRAQLSSAESRQFVGENSIGRNWALALLLKWSSSATTSS
jgi:hypothetical protein